MADLLLSAVVLTINGVTALHNIYQLPAMKDVSDTEPTIVIRH